MRATEKHVLYYVLAIVAIRLLCGVGHCLIQKH